MAHWNIDSSHSAAEFRVRHMMITWVRGHLAKLTGTIDFDSQNPAQGSIDVTMDAKSIWTGDDARDGHLRSPDFFDAEKYPEMNFKSTSIEKGDDTHFKVTGNLTIKGISKPVMLDAEYLGSFETTDPAKGTTVHGGFSASGKINRQDFGVSWNAQLDKGGVVVSDEVAITIDIEAIETK